jgi:hypothetical protein
MYKGSSVLEDESNYSLMRFDAVSSRLMLGRVLFLVLLSSIMLIPSFGQNAELNLSNSTTLASVDNTMMTPANQSGNVTELSSIGGVNMTPVVPEALIVLPEQIFPRTVVISVAAIYNNTSAIFLVNNTTILGDSISIEVFSVKTKENYSDYSIQSAQVTLDNLSVGKYKLLYFPTFSTNYNMA